MASKALLNRDEILAMLPASIQKLVSIQYRRREAVNSDEYYSGVEFGVESASEISRRFDQKSIRRKPKI